MLKIIDNGVGLLNSLKLLLAKFEKKMVLTFLSIIY